ncbi:hypothetical protein KAU32_02045 [bacterium]|nr:hypothetical protein [bacterium]
MSDKLRLRLIRESYGGYYILPILNIWWLWEKSSVIMHINSFSDYLVFLPLIISIAIIALITIFNRKLSKSIREGRCEFSSRTIISQRIYGFAIIPIPCALAYLLTWIYCDNIYWILLAVFSISHGILMNFIIKFSSPTRLFVQITSLASIVLLSFSVVLWIKTYSLYKTTFMEVLLVLILVNLVNNIFYLLYMFVNREAIKGFGR